MRTSRTDRLIRSTLVLLWLALHCCAATDATAVFRQACRKLGETPATATFSVAGRDGWFFLRNELRHLGAGPFWGAAAASASQAARDDRKDPLPAIIDYKLQLGAAGIELIVMPVPAKAAVYPDKLPVGVELRPDGMPPRLDSAHQEFYRALRQAGVTVIDLWPHLAALRKSAKTPVYCKTDTHWAGIACRRAAALLAQQLKTRPWYKPAAKTRFEAEERTVEIDGDLVWDLPAGKKPALEAIPLRFVGTREGDLIEPMTPDPASPILLLADSHGLIFHAGGEMYGPGAGLADQLAYELGIAPEVVAVKGSGATPARIALFRRARGKPEYLASKKVVVWLFAAREFTETAGWAKVPLPK